MNENTKTKQNKPGVSANTVMLPIIGVLAALYVAVILLIVSINKTGERLLQMLQDAAEYTDAATSLIAGSSLLSETSSNFVLMPLAEDGSVNVLPLKAYAAELDVPRRGEQVMERFTAYDVSTEAFMFVAAAAKSADFMLDAQLHAISLVCAVYPLDDTESVRSIPLRELTAEEKAMSDAEKLTAARFLILNTEYARNKQSVSQNVNACVACMKRDSETEIEETGRRLNAQRNALGCVALLIMLILIVNFYVIYRRLILPLDGYVRLIETDDPLPEGKGLREVRLLAGAYNRLLKRRAGLEDILRSAAETDALTGLTNRYGFQQYLLEAERSGYSLAVFLFDINYLKTTNDTQGHAAGDELIRSAAACIRECFGTEGESNCFRFGGDEFAAVKKNCTREEVEALMWRFEELQKQRGISISSGYAYTGEIGETTFKELMDEADRWMYSCKEQMHKAHGESR